MPANSLSAAMHTNDAAKLTIPEDTIIQARLAKGLK